MWLIYYLGVLVYGLFIWRQWEIDIIWSSSCVPTFHVHLKTVFQQAIYQSLSLWTSSHLQTYKSFLPTFQPFDNCLPWVLHFSFPVSICPQPCLFILDLLLRHCQSLDFPPKWQSPTDFSHLGATLEQCQNKEQNITLTVSLRLYSIFHS